MKHNNLLRNMRLQAARLRAFPKHTLIFEGEPEPWSELLDEAANALEELSGTRKYAWTPGSKFVYCYGFNYRELVCKRVALSTFASHSGAKDAVPWPVDQELSEGEVLLTYAEALAHASDNEVIENADRARNV